MVYTPQYYPGTSAVGPSRQKKLTDASMEQFVELMQRTIGPLNLTIDRPAGLKKGKRGSKGGYRIRPSEMQAEKYQEDRWPEFREPPELIRAKKAAQRAEREQRNRKRGHA